MVSRNLGGHRPGQGARPGRALGAIPALGIVMTVVGGGVCAGDLRAAAETSASARVDREVCMGLLTTCARVGERVACWGDNTQHQITASDEPQIERPRLLPEVSKARALRCGGFETCVLTSAGVVECWGVRPGAETVSLPRPARELRMHASGGCVKLDDGRVGCWRRPAPTGTRDFVEIDGAVGFAPPFEPTGGHDQVCVARSGPAAPTCFDAVSPAHLCAVRGETISCSGAASHGQLGAGPSYLHAAPVMVPELSDAVHVEASTTEVCATRRAGGNICWGQEVGTNGRIERTSFAPRAAPLGPLHAGPGPLAGLGVKTRQVATDRQCGVDVARRLVCAIRSSTSTRPGAAHLWKAPSKARFASAAGLTYDQERPVACGRIEGGASPVSASMTGRRERRSRRARSIPSPVSSRSKRAVSATKASPAHATPPGSCLAGVTAASASSARRPPKTAFKPFASPTFRPRRSSPWAAPSHAPSWPTGTSGAGEAIVTARPRRAHPARRPPPPGDLAGEIEIGQGFDWGLRWLTHFVL